MIMQNEILRDTRVVIDLDILARNMRLIKQMAGDDVAIAAVVKANGYGHGSVAIARTLMANGASCLAVATLSEALQLREVYKNYPVFIMGHTPDTYLPYVVENDVIPTVFSVSQAEILSRLAVKMNKSVKIHIKIDTGFHRLGLPADDPDRTITAIKAICRQPHIIAEGIFSHLALSSYEDDCRQYKAFTGILGALENDGITFRYRHIADSIAAVDYPEFRLNMIRPGALIYGMRGFSRGYLPVTQALTFQTKISQLHTLKAGEGVSYDYLWKATKDSVIATLPFGYADGYPRNMRDKGYVTINGIRCPLCGVICMDQCMADVTAVCGVHEGQTAVIYGTGDHEMTIAEAAALAETNKNDIISRIGTRPARVYIHR